MRVGHLRGQPGQCAACPRPDRFRSVPVVVDEICILPQIKRCGYIEGDVDYKAIAEQVYLASDALKVMTHLGYDAPKVDYKSHLIVGKTLVPDQPGLASTASQLSGADPCRSVSECTICNLVRRPAGGLSWRLGGVSHSAGSRRGVDRMRRPDGCRPATRRSATLKRCVGQGVGTAARSLL